MILLNLSSRPSLLWVKMTLLGVLSLTTPSSALLPRTLILSNPFRFQECPDVVSFPLLFRVLKTAKRLRLTRSSCVILLTQLASSLPLLLSLLIPDPVGLTVLQRIASIMSIFPLPVKMERWLDGHRGEFIWKGKKGGNTFLLARWSKITLQKKYGGLAKKNA